MFGIFKKKEQTAVREVETAVEATESKTFLSKALEKHNGKRKHAANELGISERTLYRKLKEYDILI